MLPVFARGAAGELAMKPMVQLIFEQLHNFGLRDFCFVVGRGKRAIEDHFTPDDGFLGLLKSRGKKTQALQLSEFYRRIHSSSIAWLNQSAPLGFGHAVLTAAAVSGKADVMVHAGDTLIVSPRESHLRRMLKAKTQTGASAVLLLKEVEDPRQYGVAETERKDGALLVNSVVEKPKKPSGRQGLMPIYLFNHTVFGELRSVKPGEGGEIQLTDAIQRLIDRGHDVWAVRVERNEQWLDVGTPESYWEALRKTHESPSNVGR